VLVVFGFVEFGWSGRHLMYDSSFGLLLCFVELIFFLFVGLCFLQSFWVDVGGYVGNCVPLERYMRVIVRVLSSSVMLYFPQ